MQINPWIDLHLIKGRLNHFNRIFNGTDIDLLGGELLERTIKVDGNDFFAMHLAYKEAREHASSGKGPVLIEALTYRRGAHTTSDDPTKYRTKEEEIEWGLSDPLLRLKKYMDDKGIWKEDEEKLIAEKKKDVDKQFLEAENFTPYPLDDVFNYIYVDMPDDLKRQKEEYEQFLTWKENRK